MIVGFLKTGKIAEFPCPVTGEIYEQLLEKYGIINYVALYCKNRHKRFSVLCW